MCEGPPGSWAPRPAAGGPSSGQETTREQKGEERTTPRGIGRRESGDHGGEAQHSADDGEEGVTWWRNTSRCRW